MEAFNSDKNNAAASSSDGFSIPNAPPSAFTFTTSSASGLSRPRLVKLRKHNNAPAFTPFRDSTAPVTAAPAPFSSPRYGSFSFGGNSNKSGDFGAGVDKGISDQLRSLSIGNAAKKVEGFEKVGCSSLFVDDDFVLKEMSKLNIDTNRSFVESELQNELKEKLSTGEAHKSGDSVAENSANAVINQMKNLNMIEESQVDGMKFGKGTGTEAILLREMEHLKLVNESKDSHESHSHNPFQKPVEETRVSSSAPSPIFGGLNFQPQPVGGAFEATKRDEFEFVFTGKQDASGLSSVEFKAPATMPKTNLFGGVDEKLKSNAKKGKGGNIKVNKSRAKLNQYASPTQPWSGQGFVLKDNVPQENSQGSPNAYSPMDVSPYQEKLVENQCLSENSVASNSESFSIDSNSMVNDSEQTTLVDPIDEDLIAATECLNIYGREVPCRETKEGNSEHPMHETNSVEHKRNDSISDVSVASCTSAETEADDSNIMLHQSPVSSPRNISGSGFTFAAAPSAEVQSLSPKRHYKKKSWLNFGHDTYNYTSNIKVPYSSSSVAFSPLSTTSSLFTSGPGPNAKVSLPQPKTRDSELNKEQGLKETSSVSAAAIASQEACEKWRLRGNQAYKNGDLGMAENFYKEGISCIPKEAAPRGCLRALVLCYSNLAATHMSLGRMRDALEDCMTAANIDPNFLKVQLRAANCYLALGEVEDASQYFKKCLQSGIDVCVDRKIAVEASEGLQKAQKVSDLINHSAELLQRRTSSDAEGALEHINDALMISSHSEKLLEMKAEALSMLCRYEEVIQLCDETLVSAEKNSYPFDGSTQVAYMDNEERSTRLYFRLWRCSMVVKAYFYLGKLEEGLSFLEKQEEKLSAINKSGGKVLEPLIPLVVTIQELLRHKVAGNEAFQAGKHTEAVEHYTSALSCNVESRPFAAVCYCNRAAAYKALGQITDAIADCSLAIALDGNYLKALSRRATLYEIIRDYDQAASDLRRLVSLLSKEVDDSTNQPGLSDRSTSYTNELKQNRIRLYEIEEEARKEIPLDMYLILGVEPSASSSEIKKAYRKAALRHHPDKAGQSLRDDGIWKDIAEEVHRDADRLFKIIGEAYAVLSDSAKRARYDAEEEMRNAQKKRHGPMPRPSADAQYYPFEQSGRRSWREGRRSYGSGLQFDFTDVGPIAMLLESGVSREVQQAPKLAN
ncbi:hypothetical protein AAHE18_13G096600 [Arachis hypogaea]